MVDKLTENIKTLRAKMGWTQEDLARNIDVSLTTVQRWESGKVRRPSRLAQKELSRLLKKADIDYS
ncbi:helix-turn-helix transcriptional regulator [Chloroflexota bacterium]